MSGGRVVRAVLGRAAAAVATSGGRPTAKAGPSGGRAASEIWTSDDPVAAVAAASAGTCGRDAPGDGHRVRAPGETSRARARAWAELLRLPALFTVPGDALAGAGALSARPDHRTLLAIGSSLCLYEAGMVLNDWADRAQDAVERPHRPLPSGRVSPTAAFAAACALTAAGLALAARAGRPALTIAAPLAATVWSYDLVVKHTPAGPLAMGTARGLDLLLGAAATAGRTRPALPSAALLATHTFAVTTLSRQETHEGTPSAALAALATTGALTWLLQRRPPPGRTADRRSPSRRSPGGEPPVGHERPGPAGHRPAHGSPTPVTAALTTAYATATARSYLHACLNPSPPLTQHAVGAGIRATISLQAALLARSGATATALLTAALTPFARRFARRVSIT